MNKINIRKYQSKDRDQLRQIAWNTAFLGKPANIFFSHQKILTDNLTKYFTDYEPQSCFVAEINNKIIGYLIGSLNEKNMQKIYHNRIFIPLILKALSCGAFFDKKNIIFSINMLKSWLKGEFRNIDYSDDYPAILHINISREFRQQAIGSYLINAYIEYLKQNNILGVHLSTSSESAGIFFQKQGFILLNQYRRSYFHYILGKNITNYIYGKKII